MNPIFIDRPGQTRHIKLYKNMNKQ